MRATRAAVAHFFSFLGAPCCCCWFFFLMPTAPDAVNPDSMEAKQRKRETTRSTFSFSFWSFSSMVVDASLTYETKSTLQGTKPGKKQQRDRAFPPPSRPFFSRERSDQNFFLSLSLRSVRQEHEKKSFFFGASSHGARSASSWRLRAPGVPTACGRCENRREWWRDRGWKTVMGERGRDDAVRGSMPTMRRKKRRDRERRAERKGEREGRPR